MNKILVDSSVWISFFKGNEETKPLINLIDDNLICINSLILSELIPPIIHRKEFHLVDLLKNIDIIQLKIDWNEIIQFQTKNLKNGINKVGIPDLIILQSALQNNIPLYSFDKHFVLISPLHGLKLFPNEKVV